MRQSKILNFVLFIPCTTHNQFTRRNQQNAQNCSLVICITVPHWTFLLVSICKGHSSGNQTTAIQHKTKLATIVHIWHSAKEENSKSVQMRWFLVSSALVQLSYKEMSTFLLFACFTLCQLRIKLANLVWGCTAFVWFPDDVPLRIETGMFYLRIFFLHFVGFMSWINVSKFLLINHIPNQEVNFQGSEVVYANNSW
jgi:hypothetical protein